MKRLVALLVLLSAGSAFAGTGGAELNDFWTWISDALSGTLGKLAAAGVLGASVFTLVRGGILFGIFLFVLALGIAIIPTVIDNRYTLSLLGF